MKTVLITGSCGLVGTHLVKKCLDLGFSVIGVDLKDNTENIDNQNFKYIKKDLSIGGAVEELFRENKFDCVFNTFGVKG